MILRGGNPCSNPRSLSQLGSRRLLGMTSITTAGRNLVVGRRPEAGRIFRLAKQSGGQISAARPTRLFSRAGGT